MFRFCFGIFRCCFGGGRKTQSDRNNSDGSMTPLRTTASATGQRQPPFSASLPTTYDALTALSYQHLETLMGAHECICKFSEAKSYNVDLAGGTITWSYDHNKIVRAPGQLLGTWYNGRFLWGWAHPSAPPGTAIAASAVKEYADRHGIVELQDSQPTVSFDDSWKLVSVAALIGNLQGIYRGESGPHGAWAYIGFGTIELSLNNNLPDPTTAVVAGPPTLDFLSVDSQEKAHQLYQTGALAQIYLRPIELGGMEHRVNQVYVPKLAVARKAHFDQQVAHLVDAGLVTNFSVEICRLGRSVVPTALFFKLTGPNGYTFDQRIEIWG